MNRVVGIILLPLCLHWEQASTGVLSVLLLSVWWEICTSAQDGCGLTLGNLTNLNRYISFDINMAFLVGPANSDVQFRDSSSWQYENGIFIWAGELALWMYGKCSGFWLRNRRLGSALSSPSMSNMSEFRSPFWMTVIFLILFDIYWYES